MPKLRKVVLSKEFQRSAVFFLSGRGDGSRHGGGIRYIYLRFGAVWGEGVKEYLNINFLKPSYRVAPGLRQRHRSSQNHQLLLGGETLSRVNPKIGFFTISRQYFLDFFLLETVVRIVHLKTLVQTHLFKCNMNSVAPFRLSVHLSVRPSAYLSVRPSVRLSPVYPNFFQTDRKYWADCCQILY